MTTTNHTLSDAQIAQLRDSAIVDVPSLISVCDELIRLRAERGDYDGALAVSEKKIKELADVIYRKQDEVVALIVERDRLRAGVQRAREALESTRDCGMLSHCEQCRAVADEALKGFE